MAKSSSRSRILRKSRNVSSFLEESIENVTSLNTTMNVVVVDIHNEDERLCRRDNENDVVTEFSSDKRARLSERSSSSKSSSRRSSKIFQDENLIISNDRFEESHNLMKDLTDEPFSAPERNAKSLEIDSFPEMKSRRRRQWNTTNATSEAEDSRRAPRKRWSKDTSVIRLPETSDVSPSIKESRKPVPAPRASMRREAFFDNPAFVSENEEVLRIETDYKRESTKIEIRRMNDRSNIEDIEDVDTSSSRFFPKKNRSETTARDHEHFTDSDPRSSSARFSENKKSSLREFNSSSSLGRPTDAQSSSISSEEMSTGERNKLDIVQNQLLKKRERSLFRIKDSPSDEFNSTKNAKSIVDIETMARVKKKKREQRNKGKKEEKEEETRMRYISIMIHRADMFEADYVNVKRPLVKVHIVDACTGDYLRNTENRENGSVFLQPMITGKFDFKGNRSMIPVWEEELIFEHDFNAITKREEDCQVVILFEVIDLLSFAEASFSYDKLGSEECWNKIAWAFLKPVGANNTLYTGRKVRLQLYKPKSKRSFKKYGRAHKCEVYTWWQSNNRDKYPSSLFVTVASIPPPKPELVFYRQLALNDLSDTRSGSRGISMRASGSINLPKWARLAAQSCKIPNEKIFEMETNESGCFYVAFSSDGKYLACVHSEEYNYPIVIYEVKTNKIYVRFFGHKAFVYSLSWSSDDHHLLSASADQTARIWDVHNQIVQYIEMLPHPSYVYCARYGSGNMMIIATGCYDCIVRIWAYDRRSRKRELSQELEGHEGFVNSIVFQKNDNLITADSVGAIIIWTVRKNSKMPSKREWCVSKKIKVREIEGVVINTIALHPLQSRLLVHSRNNGLRILDLATGVVLRKYEGLNNQRIQLKACISPCGSLILCGGEDSVLNVWNLETGKLVAKYTNERSYRAVTCVDYHPYDHVLAFSTFGSPIPVRVLRFNKNIGGSNIGLKIIEDESQNFSNKLNTNILATTEEISHNRISSTSYKRMQMMHPNIIVQSLKRNHRIINAIDYMINLARKSRQAQSSAIMNHRSFVLIESSRSDLCKEVNRPRKIEEKERFRETKFYIAHERPSSSVEYLSLLFPSIKTHRMIIQKRPESAKEISANKIIDQDRFKTLSDCEANFTYKSNDNPFPFIIDVRENVAEDFAIRSKKQNHSFDSSNSIPISIDRADIARTLQEHTSDSANTYVIDMTDFEENADAHQSVAKHIINTKNETIDVIEGSDSSISSHATFTVKKNLRLSKQKYNSRNKM